MENQATALAVGSIAAVARSNNQTLADVFVSLDALVMVDVSTSMNDHDAPNGQTRWQAATAELLKLQRSLPGKIGVISFNDHAEFRPEGMLPPANGSTQFVPPLRLAKLADGTGIRLILISDGEAYDYEAAIALAQSFTSRIDTIFVGPEVSNGRQRLAKLSEATGGIAVRYEAARLNLLAESVTRLLSA